MNAELLVLGLNHRSAPVALREAFACGGGECGQGSLLAAGTIEAVRLHTCNRSEWILLADAPETALAAWRTRICREGQLGEADFQRCFYCHRGPEALLHLARVASGLDSMITGEPQILGQFKAAFQQAFACGAAAAGMDRVLQRVLRAAKRVRSETAVGRGAVSVAAVAVQLARSMFDDLSSRRVLILGAGEMCEQAAAGFAAAGAQRLTVLNRTPERAAELAARFQAASGSLAELPAALAEADIVLSSTASPAPLLTVPLLCACLPARHGCPLFIIDIAVPRDAEPAVNDLDGVYLYNIDDLQELVAQSQQGRQAEAAKAEALLRAELAAAEALDEAELGSLISTLRERADDVRQQELERLFRRHPAWSEEDRRQIERSVGLILNRLMHDPLVSLRRSVLDDEPAPRSLVQFCRRFFNL